MNSTLSVTARLAVAVVVALVVGALLGVAPLLAPSGGGVDAGPDQPAYDADRLVPERLASSGQANPNGDVGVVLFDRSHDNRFETEDVSSLVRAIDSAGGEVRFTGASGGFQAGLRHADVLVIVDPATSYSTEEVDAIERFVDAGGRVLVLGEPNRKRVNEGGLSASLVTNRAKVTTVGSRFGISFGSQYLYDMENNDGNFKNVLASPPDRTGADAVSGIDRVALYTAASVETDRGTVLLRTPPTTQRDDAEARNGYPVAVLSPGGEVMAVGDKTFLGEEYHAVADNDVFVERIVEFMAGANHRPGQRDAGTEEPSPPGTTPPAD